eukprot:g5167.t1
MKILVQTDRAASSCRGEDLTEQEQDWRWCLVRLLTRTVFPKILGTDRESVRTFRKLQTKHEFQTKRLAILAFLQAFTRTSLPEVPFAFTTTHSLEAIEDLLEGPLVRYKFYLKSVGGGFFEEVTQDQDPSAQAEVATATENQEDLDQALEAKGGISHQKTGLMWQFPRCRRYKSFTGAKFCSIDGHPCTLDDYGRKIVFQNRRPCDNPLCAYMLDREQKQVACPNCKVRQAWDEVKKPEPATLLRLGRGGRLWMCTSWDMTALDALPAPKHGQPPEPFTDVGEYLHCCELFTVGSKKAYMEVRFRIFCASTAEFSFKLENKEEQTLPEKCMLAEVYEIRGAGAFSDSSTFACMGEDECRRLIKRLREMWKGGDDYKRKLFSSTIDAGKLNKVFHGASRLKRAMMAVDISSYAKEEPTDSNKVWYWRESVAWEMLPPLETLTDEDLQSYWDSDSEDEEELALTGRDMGRMSEKGYVVEYLRPCLPVEVPTKEDSAGRKVDSSFLADYNVNNSANWRSHKQANVCLDNVFPGPRKRKQTSVPVAEAKSMLGSSNVVPVSSMHVPVDKGQCHMVHFWGNDYTAIDLFPAKPPIFYPCFQSLKDYKLIFTNLREKKDAYTGKVQDWDFRLGTEIFDDGVRQQHILLTVKGSHRKAGIEC